jgi:hypothetical protein
LVKAEVASGVTGIDAEDQGKLAGVLKILKKPGYFLE